MTTMITPQAGGPSAPLPASRATVPLVRDEVRKILTRTPSFRRLPEAQQRELAHAMVNVGQYITDLGGETYGVPLGAAITGDAGQAVQPAAHALAGQAPRPDTAGARFDAAGGAVAARSGADALVNLVSSVDFPKFVSGLIQGVFQAIVDASIQQMEAFAELVRNVSKSVDEYMKDNITTNQARDNLVGRYPDVLQLDLSQDQPRVVPKPEADDSQLPDFFKDLGLASPVDSLDEDTPEQVLVPATRQQLAIDRQRMLLMMVMMGINRLVVTDGSIKAAVIFNLKTKDSASVHRERATDLDRNTKRTSSSSWISDWFSPEWDETTTTEFQVTTGRTEDSDAKVDLQAKLTGDVNVQFRSETFPLDQMTQLLGLQQPTLPTVSQPAPEKEPTEQ